ncbi:hypothetical protein B7494_g1853 [Chlorociboria aeruginascens]|nr:hypothetical protein B7494_g1853 [Chlorociboria aeruginascens]
MASTGGAILDTAALERRVRNGGMINKTLAQICIAEGLNKHGNKSDLQAKLIAQLQHHVQMRDIPRLERLKRMIENPESIQHQDSPTLSQHGANGSASPALPVVSNNPSRLNMATGFRANGAAGVEFKPSPFYTIQQQLGITRTCEAMTQHRHTVSIPLKASDHPILSRVLQEPTLKIMVFGSCEGHGPQDIAFPHQSEIKVNGGEVKANLRGLKNKPGSTRPVDITKELRLKIPAYSNNVEMTYALTSKAGGGPSQKFYLMLYVVKMVPVLDLVKRLDTGKRISKDTIISDMVNKARDADIVATASVLSLKCPLSTLRIDLPCRSISCRHNQCFDATSYLQLQEQGPTWLCPVCNKPAPFDMLAVDEYVKDILKNTSNSADQVTIEPDGRWSIYVKPESSKTNGVASTSNDDDDLVEVTKSGHSLQISTPLAYTVPTLSRAPTREPSSSFLAQGSTSGKRPISAVIDLTSSGDEDDQPLARPQKRPHSNAFSTPSAAYPSSNLSPTPYRPAPNGYGQR